MTQIFGRVLFAFGVSTLGANLATAQTGNFGLELNSLQDVNGNCRTTFVATNNTGIGLTAVSFEMVIWDNFNSIPQDGFYVFEIGRMPIAKTKVVQFDIPSRTCNAISRILVNDLVDCTSPSGDHDFCLTGLIAASRSTVVFGQ